MKFLGRKHSQEELKARWEKEESAKQWRGGFLWATCRNGLHSLSGSNIFYAIRHGKVTRLCFECKKATNLRSMKTYQETHKDGRTNYRNSRARKYHDIVIDAYGGKCECCGETRREFLTVEHRKGDGHAHRAKFGQNVFWDIARQGFPKDKYGVLCMNCNFAKGRGKLCPHEIERQEAMKVYPGQEYFRALNPNIRKTEENWEIAHGLRKTA